MEYQLELKNISKSFGDVRANKNINLQIKTGEIQALLGENGAGKSTLVKMIYGINTPDEGEIYWNGKQIKNNHPDKAKKLGIHMIFQHFSLLDSFTVTQNIAISMKAQKPTKQLEKIILEVSHKYGLPLEPNKRVLDLSVSEKQRIEIVRSLMQNPKLLIMDEPTSVLNPLEISSLFSFLKKLRDEGCSILYISHKLEEIMELCDRATILRQGEVISHCDPKKQTKSSLAEMMVGKKIKSLEKRKKKVKTEIFFEVKDLSLKSKDENLSIQNISFAVNKGEIFAIGGVSGNGQQTLQKALSGLQLCGCAGQICLEGEPFGKLSVKQRRKKQMAFVSEERLGTSAVPEMSLVKNTFLTGYLSFKDYLKNQLICYSRVGKETEAIIQNFNVVAPSKETTAKNLSGGNLQKFIIGREIRTAPKLLIVVDPTWGVDAGAENFIHQTLIHLAEQGTTILLISQDLNEIYAISDRVAVMYEGKLSPAYQTKKISNKKMGLLMGGESI